MVVHKGNGKRAFRFKNVAVVSVGMQGIVNDGITRFVDVRAHQIRGPTPTSPNTCRNDLIVFALRIVQTLRGAAEDAVALGLICGDAIDHAEIAIVRSLNKSIVELGVQSMQKILIVGRAGEIAQIRGVEIFAQPAAVGEQRVGFNALAHLKKLIDRSERDWTDEYAALRLDDDQPFLLKAAESIAHRRAACAKALAKGILIQLTSRRVLTVDDGMLYGVVDLLL